MLAEGMQHSPDVPQRYRDDAQTILTQIKRCRDIVNELNAGEIGADSLRSVSVRALLEELDVRLDAPADITAVLPERAFTRVVASLVKNARDAQAKNVTLHLREKDGGFAVRVSDDGPGIPPQILRQLGEPYVTTKGTGLGLYLSAVFAESLRGTLTVETGNGTTVELFIPHV